VNEKHQVNSLTCFNISARLHMNRQAITLLAGLGVRQETFYQLQEQMLFQMADMLIKENQALKALQKVIFAIEYLIICLVKPR
jgi:hypothetical protein